MNATTNSLKSRKTQPIRKGASALSQSEVSRLLGELPGWETKDSKIARTYSFKNYYETMAFVNAVAWIAHGEDHHPDLEVGFNKCRVTFSTHSVGGLSENDFICAAKVEELLKN